MNAHTLGIISRFHAKLYLVVVFCAAWFVQRICSAAGYRAMAVSKRSNRTGVVVGYQVSVTLPDPKTDKKRRKVVGTYLRRKEADAAERKAKIQIQDGTFELKPSAPVKDVTVADTVAVWFDAKKLSIQPNSATGYKSAIDLHVIPAFGDISVTELAHDDVQRQVNQWTDDGMGHGCFTGA